MVPKALLARAQAYLKQDDIPTEFCKMVYEKTRGNPFFTEEVIESLKEENLIHREEGKWEFKEISAIARAVAKNRFNWQVARIEKEGNIIIE